MANAIAGIFGFIIILVVGMLASFLWARVLQDMWAWFVAPLFHLPLLPFWNAMGVMLLATAFTHGLARSNQADDDVSILAAGFTQIVASIVAALLTWAFAALYANWGGL